MNGILIVDKPAGWTSHDVVAKLRGALKTKRIGHGGTLDPMATGVLPVFVGGATRAAEFCENAEKEYIAGLRLGIVTDTQDITGRILEESGASASNEDLAIVLQSFLGAQKQTPPMYSAIKQNGKKLYELARRGVEVPRQARGIYVFAIELLSGGDENKANISNIADKEVRGDSGSSGSRRDNDDQNDFLLRVVCTKGTYIRTLCHDIGSALGCGGTMSSLRRTRAGAYTIEMSHTLETILSAASSGGIDGYGSVDGTGGIDGYGSVDGTGGIDGLGSVDCHGGIGGLGSAGDHGGIDGLGGIGGLGSADDHSGIGGLLLPVDSIFSEYPAVTLTADDTRRLKNGASSHPCKLPDGKYRFYGPDNEFLLLGSVANRQIKVIKRFFGYDRE